MNVLNSPIPFPVPGEPQLDVTELSHWSQFQLDLIIAGFNDHKYIFSISLIIFNILFYHFLSLFAP